MRIEAIIAQGVASYAGKTDWEGALQHAREGLLLARQLGDRVSEARSLWILLMAVGWSHPEEALEFGNQGLAIARELANLPSVSQKEQELLALLLIDSVGPLGIVGEIKLARERAVEGMAIAEKLENLPMVTTGGTFLSWIYAAEGRFVEAKEELERIAAINRSITNEGGVLSAYNNLIFSLPSLGDFAELFSTIEFVRPLAEREGRYPLELYELYQVIPHYWLGATGWVQKNLDRLIATRGRVAIFPQMFLSYASLVLIQDGEYRKAAELLEEIDGLDRENYLQDAYPNVIQIPS